MRILLRHPSGLAGLVFLGIVLIGSLIGWAATPYDPTAFSTGQRFQPPSHAHLLGTDQFGRDIFSRILAGGHLTLTIGLAAVAIALVFGGGIGAIAGFRGGKIDLAVVALMDMLLAFPAVLLALGIVAVLGASATNVIIAVGIANIPTFARVARASVLTVMVLPHVRAAVALGCRDVRIFVRHVLPNIAGPMTVLTMMSTATAILVGSTLSFLGLGAAPPTPEWGVMLSDSRAYAQLGWWLTIMPGVAIAVVVLALNLLGDALRDVLDPTSRTLQVGA
jgi:peptide/nickel transport system permease protein